MRVLSNLYVALWNKSRKWEAIIWG